MKQNQKLILITGMSGAGKTLVLKNFEDLGYFCVDNAPLSMLSQLMKLMKNSRSVHRAAVELDLRSPQKIAGVADRLGQLLSRNAIRVIFVDASDAQLVARFKQHRKFHPESPNTQVTDGIQRERKLLRRVKAMASIVINTTNLTPAALTRKLTSNFKPFRMPRFHVDVMSFGFKYGMPLGADLMFDVRFLPNPFYVKSLKYQSGLDQPVYDYVMNHQVTEGFYRRLISLLEYALPGYIKEGKPSLTIAIGCTGGRHRSVAMARRVGRALSKKYPVNVTHRDVGRDIELEKRNLHAKRS